MFKRIKDKTSKTSLFRTDIANQRAKLKLWLGVGGFMFTPKQYKTSICVLFEFAQNG